MVAAKQEWLLVFYSVPSQPVSNRMKIWRKLAKAGAVQVKGAVYVLPATEGHAELLQWLIGEVRSMGGDGAFVRAPGIETMEDADVRKLFMAQSEKEYRSLEKTLEGLERKVQSIRKGTKLPDKRVLTDQFARTRRDFEEVRKRDFFSSGRGHDMESRLRQVEAALKGLDKTGKEEQSSVTAKKTQLYQGRAWITRTNPFVDRMSSAWLIKKFVDPAAAFQFTEERALPGLTGVVSFDIKGGEFTHHGDLCTFEVLVKAFGIKDRAVRKIAQIVHDLDVKDDKYGNTEGPGVEEILSGIRKTAKDDLDALERGMAVFEMLYQSRT
jgi:hypothetical protein